MSNTKLSQAADAVTIRAAAVRLDITQQHLRRLLREGKISAIGKGTSRAVLVSSLEKFEAEHKKTNMCAGIFVTKAYKGFVQRILTTLPPLSRPDSAARLLGLPEGEFADLMTRGEVPMIAVGTREYVPAKWLANLLGRAYLEKAE